MMMMTSVLEAMRCSVAGGRTTLWSWIGAAVFAATVASSVALAKDAPIQPYPLGACIVSGEELGTMGDPVVYSHDGREIRFCCEQCVGKFEKDPTEYLQKLDAAIIDQQATYYPLETCVVSGEALESKGGAFQFVYDNRLVRLCCEKCTGEFENNAAKHLQRLDQAVVAAQTDAYPAERCPVSGMALGEMGQPYDHVFASRLVRFCCGGCVAEFNANPAAAMNQVYGVGQPAGDRTRGQHDDHHDASRDAGHDAHRDADPEGHDHSGAHHE